MGLDFAPKNATVVRRRSYFQWRLLFFCFFWLHCSFMIRAWPVPPQKKTIDWVVTTPFPSPPRFRQASTVKSVKSSAWIVKQLLLKRRRIRCIFFESTSVADDVWYDAMSCWNLAEYSDRVLGVQMASEVSSKTMAKGWLIHGNLRCLPSPTPRETRP